MSLDVTQPREVRLQDYFNTRLKKLKRTPGGNGYLAEELPFIFEALARNLESVEIDGARFNLSNLNRKDLIPLLKVANKFFSTQHEGLLNNTLLENLHTLEKRYDRSYLGIMIQRAEAALTMSNEPNLQVEETKGAKAVRDKILEANEKIKRDEKLRKYGKIALVASVVIGSIGLGIFAASLILLPAFVVPIGFMIFSIGFTGAMILPITITKDKPDADQKDHAYWTYILTYSQTEEFKKYKELQKANADTDSIDFLEAAALVHLKTQDILDNSHIYKPNEERLEALEKIFGEDFIEQNEIYTYSKTIEFSDFEVQYDAEQYRDPDFVKYAYLQQLEKPSKTQTDELEVLKQKFTPKTAP